MALAVLLMVVCAGAAIDGYVEFSEEKMPQYAGEEYDDRAPAAASDEYRDHSPDAPASLDYNTDEESNEKTRQSIFNENYRAEGWQKRQNKIRNARPKSDGDLDNTVNNNNVDESVPKLKSNSRLIRSRLRNNNPEMNDRITYKGTKKSRRNSNDDTERLKEDFQINKLVFGEEKPADETGETPVEIEEDGNYLAARKTTEKQARRKSRDKYVTEGRQRSDVEEEQEVESLRSRHVRREQDHHIQSEQWRRLSDDYDSPPLRPSIGERRMRPKVYDIDNDYYDTKRAHDVYSKLPYRRTKARVALPSRTTTRLGVLSWTTRHMHTLPPMGRAPSPSSPVTTTPTTTTSTTTTATTATTTTSKTTTYTVQALVKRDVTVKNTSEELSIAEKSRLSILKKAQKKERSHNSTTTKKPPVLLLVSQMINTMIVVEPPSSQEPWMRASIVSNDSPDLLNKVKSLMRHKLVANARDIHDLTDNWDEMVCDYIDVTMLKSAASVQVHWTHFIVILLIFYFN